MRLIILSLVALPVAASANIVLAPAEPPAIVKPAPDRGVAIRSEEDCRSGPQLVANPRLPEVRMGTLADQPNAVRMAAVLRKIGPCPAPIVFDRNIGSRPDLPAPSIAGDAQMHEVPDQ